MEEKLISLVRDSEFLYRKSDKRYKNLHLKEKEWAKIAKTLGKDVEIVKKRWKTLRDKFNLEQKKLCGISVKAKLEPTPKWKYFECMEFLRDEYQERCTPTNLQIKSNFTDTIPPEEDEFSNMFSTELEIKTGCSTPSRSIQNEHLSYQNNVNESILKTVQSAEKKFEDFLQKANRALNEPQEEPQQYSVTKGFFSVMANELDKANLPESSLRQIRRKVMSIVYDALDTHQN